MWRRQEINLARDICTEPLCIRAEDLSVRPLCMHHSCHAVDIVRSDECAAALDAAARPEDLRTASSDNFLNANRNLKHTIPMSARRTNSCCCCNAHITSVMWVQAAKRNLFVA